MSIDNVYLSIVNDREAVTYLRRVVDERVSRRQALLYNYSPSALRHAAERAGVEPDAKRLTLDKRLDAWALIIDHIFDIDLNTHPDYNPQLKEKEKTMITVETKHFVGNQDVATMSADDLIDVVKRLEKEIADLKGVSSESKYIDGKVKELQTTLKDVVKHLDSK